MWWFILSLDYAIDLRPDTIFVVTQTMFDGSEQSQYLLINNILLGTSLKIKSPCLHYATNCLSHAVKRHGVYTAGEEYKRLLLDGRDVIDNLCKPDERERSKYYDMVRSFVGSYFLFTDKTYPENHYFLGKNNIFGVSYGLEDHELIISNTLNGKALKVEKASDYNTTKFMVEFIKTKGVCDHEGEFCLALLSKDQIYSNLGVAQTAKEKMLKKKILTFISNNASKES